MLKPERISRTVTLISQAGHDPQHPHFTAPVSDGPYRHWKRTAMTKIFDALYAETYRVAIGLPAPKLDADCSEFPGLVPARTRTLWLSIAAAWSSFSGVLEEPELQFSSDYWLGP
jgi:hypothetical protein